MSEWPNTQHYVLVPSLVLNILRNVISKLFPMYQTKLFDWFLMVFFIGSKQDSHKYRPYSMAISSCLSNFLSVFSLSFCPIAVTRALATVMAFTKE